MDAEVRRDDPIKEISEQITAARTADEALTALTEGLVRLINADGAVGFLLDDEAEHLHGRIAQPAEFQETIGKVRLSVDDEASAAAIAFRSRGPIVIDDAETDARVKKWLMVFYRAKSLMAIPIMTADRTFGAVVVFEHHSRHFTEDETRTALSLAGKTAQALERISKGK